MSVLPLAARRHKSVVPDSLQRIDIKIHIAGKDSLSGKDLHFIMQRVETNTILTFIRTNLHTLSSFLPII